MIRVTRNLWNRILTAQQQLQRTTKTACCSLQTKKKQAITTTTTAATTTTLLFTTTTTSSTGNGISGDYKKNLTFICGLIQQQYLHRCLHSKKYILRSDSSSNNEQSSSTNGEWNSWHGLGGGLLLTFTLPWKKLPTEEEELEQKDPLLYNLKKGVLCMQRGEYSKALEHYHMGLELCAEQHKNQTMDDRKFLLAQINIFSLMATASMKSGDYKNAEKLYKDVMAKCIASGRAQDDESIIELSIKLASLYAMQSRDEEAEVGFKFCLTAVEKKVKEAGGILDADSNTLALYGLTTQSYARFMMKKKEHKEAIRLFKISLETAIEVYGADHPQVFAVMNDVATSYVINRQYKEGQDIYLEGISRAERLDHAQNELTAFLYNLGEAYIMTQDYKQAMKYCKRCKEVARTQGDERTIRLAIQCIQDINMKSKEPKDRSQHKEMRELSD